MDITDILYIVWCVIAGSGIVFQGGINSTLAQLSKLKSFSALMSFVLGIIPIFIYFCIESKGFSKGDYSNIPFWAWLGGVFGGFYVITIIFTIPRLGAAAVLSTTVAAQIVLSIILDHFGIIGLQKREATWLRILGGLLSVAGAILIVLR